ncbi:ABC transporter permease [Candidatus Formimonas warabiya]|uniref:Peptide ABC transporter permease n=1 Tax=Formimonas warabiya TaxID=1761012 RepID=A0A3G1KZ74_FORW1|nr:ABC transporter permease [Candidatus Formimonas warabiya]ATW27813.1 peptide ABC transporter permease [Candidatus Formimonas warabiya]ATW27826.1 peptide ABC transporter permease [Candidatus Formimonas warabiya]
MLIYILRRLGFIILTMFLASLIIFSVTQLLPGDVAQVVLGQFATQTALDNLREELGLNLPLHTQYLNWITHFVQGDWGNSLTSRMPVRPMIMARLYNSAMLAGVALVIYVPLGILLGVIAALHRNKLLDKIISGVSMAFVGLPEFVTGLLLITFLAIGLGWFPGNSSINPESTFREAFYYLILPAITVSLTSLGYVARMTRSGTIDVLRTDYVRAAYLKGLSRGHVLIRHVLRNALLPTVTVVAMGIGWLLGGLIVTESVFGYPGMGRLLVYAIQRRDLPLIQAGSMIIVMIYSLSNLGADILYSYLNPRIRVRK